MESEPSRYEADSELLFATDIANNVIKLKNVILNEFHVLRKFSFISLCNETLRVKLESDLGSQIGFQIDNENFDHENIAEQTVATFLADDFNQLFNTVNLVSEVILQPRQVQQVILTFRPTEPLKGLSNEKYEDNINQISEQNASTNPVKRLSSNVTEIFQVNGNLSFSASVLGDSFETRQEGATSINHQKITVQFYSTVCRSVLQTDVSEIVFEDCVPGGVFVKDFSVWNLSEIPGSFELNVKCGPSEKPEMELTDYDTGLPISRGDIKSFSHRRIRVTYKPKDVGDFTYIIHLQNNFDERNSKSVPFRCIVNSEHRQEGLLVTGVGEDGVLDFGDCYSGNGTCQLLTLRNVTQEALVVNLSSDHASSDRVTFYRQTELDLLSAASKARLKDVVSPVEDDVVSLEGAHKELLALDKLGNPAGPSVIVNKKSKVDMITLAKGEEKNLLVWLFPAGASDDLKAARLQRRNFRLSLKCAEKKGYSKQRFSKIIQCKAQICTSIVKLSTQELNFGDCNVGSTKASSVQIHNLSDLPALITPYVTSTILSIKSQAERVSIPARQTHSLDIDLVPLKINHKYRKQIRVDNLLNKENNQVLEVRAKIMDRHHVLFHSVYYKLQTPSLSNFITFDNAVVNNPCVKIMSVENITDKELVLDFNTNMPEELSIYTLQDNSSSECEELGVGDECSLSSETSEEDIHENRKRAYAASINKEKILETLEESQPRLSKAIVDSAPFPLQQGHSKTAASRSSFSSPEKKARMRMSLDLSSSPLSTNLTSLPSLDTGPLAISAITNDSSDKVVADVKSFGATDQNAQPGTLKRVQSDAMLIAADDASGILASSRRSSSDDDYLEEVLTRLGCEALLEFSFTDEDGVKKFIDSHIRDRELTMHAVEDIPHSLLPVGRLELLPGVSRNLYVILVVDGNSHTDLQGRLKKLDAKVTIQMIEYDKERQEHLEPGFLEPTVDDDLLTREIPVEIKVCRALLSIAQKNISFGKLFTNEHRAKTLVLNNVSDVPLPYKIKKSGSIASGDLHIIDGRTGVLQPHSSQEVNFVFQPSLSGSFYETLVVSNVYDPSNDQVVTLKATISRAETFWLKSNSINFGAVVSGQWSSPQSFVFSNTSKQSRTFMLREVECAVEKKGLPMSANLETTLAHPALRKLRFVIEAKKETLQGYLRPEQEAIEALERKALAYERKGKADKVIKIRKEIEELKGKETGNGNICKHEEVVSGDGLDHMCESKVKQSPSNHLSNSISGDVPLNVEKDKDLTSKSSDGFISFTLKANESQVVLVSCYAWMPEPTPLGEQIKGAFLAYESKNQDVVKHVEFEATVCSDNSFHEDHSLSSMRQVPNNKTGEDSPNSLLSLSPTVTPDSSVPTSPSGGRTPQMLSSHQASRMSSASSLFASIEPVDLNFDGGIGVATSTSCKLSNDLEHLTTATGSFRSEKVAFPINEKDSVVMDECNPSSPKALFKVDLLQLGKLQSLLKDEQRTNEAKSLSLVEQSKFLMGKELAGEVVLEDHAGGDMMEASYLLRSMCPHDIWIHFVLDWPRARDLQLWVSDLGVDQCSNASSGITSGLAGARSENGSWSRPAFPSQPTQLQWYQLESQGLEKVSIDTPKLMTSSCLKGGMGQWITLRMIDDVSLRCVYPVRKDILNTEDSAMTNDCICGQGFGMGTLTMQSQPSGKPVQLLVRAKQVEKFLKIEPADILFPESDLSTVLMKEITISNRSRSRIEYDIKVSGVNVPVFSKVLDKSPAEGRLSSLNDSVVSVTPAYGRIDGNGSVTAKIVCKPVKSGKQSYTIHLRSSFCLAESQVCVTMAPRKVQRLRLPDFPLGSVLDMGYCFINAPEGSKVAPLRLENLHDKPLSLAFRSNLAKQAFISLNPSGSSRTDEMQLQGASSETVYLCLRPGGDASAYKNGRCREVIGGMRISVKSTDTTMSPSNSQEDVQDEIMVKFRAMVGQSLLQVSTSLVDLGRLKEIGGFISGFFVVSNPSNQMPLHFSLSAGKSILSVLKGYLIGKEATSSTSSEEKSEIAIGYCLPVAEYGLIEDRVVVQNLSCPGQNAEVMLRVYVDRGNLKCHVQPPNQRLQCFNSEGEDILATENLFSDEYYRFSNLSAISTVAKDVEKILAFEGLSPRRTYSLPTVNSELENFQDRPNFNVDSIAGPLQDNHYLDMGIVYVSLVAGGIEVGSGSTTDREVKSSAGYSISDLRPYHASLLLTNSSDEVLTLQPVSTLPLQVFVENQGVCQMFDKSSGIVDSDSGQNIWMTSSALKEAPGSLSDWSSCGKKFSILPGSAVRLLVACGGVQPLSSMDVSLLEKGKLCAFEGLLAFCKSNVIEISEDFKCEVTALQEEWNFSQFLEFLTVKGSMCVSYGEVEMKEINLGKVGDANGWQDLGFDVEVHNSSDAKMIFQITDAPDIFSFSFQGLELVPSEDGFTPCHVPARELNSIQVILHLSKLEHKKEARTWSWKLCLVNCNNRKNIMEVSIFAEMTVRNLRFVGLTDSIVTLPPLTVPLQPNTPPCSRRFSVENLSTEPIGVALELHQVEDTESLVMLEVTSNENNSSITDLTLQPGETMELQVGARLVSDFIPHAIRSDDVERHSNSYTISPRGSLENEDKAFAAAALMNMKPQESSEMSWISISNSDLVSSYGSRMVSKRSTTDSTGFREDGTFCSEENLSDTLSMVCLGHMYLYSSPLPDCIDIFGTLIQGPMLGVSPSSLHFEANVVERDILNHADDAGNGFDTTQAISNSNVEYDSTSLRLGTWNGWNEKSSFSQKLVVQNYLAFDHLHLKVWDQQSLSDGFGTQLRFLEVHPREALVPPKSSVDIIVKFPSWSDEMCEAFSRQVSEGHCTAECLTASVFIQDVEERDSRQKVDVFIMPPLVPQNSPFQAAGLDTQTQDGTSRACDSAIKELVKSVNHSKPRLPVLGLRGCTAVNGSSLCYEFNLGQQNISSGGHRHWNLIIVGDQERPISYRLCTISDGDAGWLSISSSSGIVESLRQNIVKLSFSTKAMGVYSTYLVVENLDNPADLKTVHLSMEVVALKNARPEAPLVPFFYVLVQGDRAEGVAIDMAEIYYNFWYRNRSFVIVNEASVAMEFLLSSTLDHNDSTELNFSLENTSLKRFSSVTIDAKSSIRLWIHFCIGAPKEEPLAEDMCDELSATIFVNCRLVKDYQRCIPFRAKCRYPQIGISSTDVVFSTRKHGSDHTFTEITSDAGNFSTANGGFCCADGPVNAPFIENEVLLGSTGIQQLGCVPSGSSLEASGSRNGVADDLEVPYDVLRSSQQSGPAHKAHREDDLDLIPSFQILTLRNLYLHRKLEYVVKNDSLFFKVNVPASQEIPGVISQGLRADVLKLSTKKTQKSCHEILVRPNLDTLRENLKMVMKQKYIEEHLTIYNRSNPREKYTVSLRLTAGHLRNFFAASGPKKSYTFERLELAITSFLSTFYSLMNGLVKGLHEKSTIGSRLDMQISANKKDYVGLKNGNSKEAGLAPGKLVKQGSWSMQSQDAFQEFEKVLESFSNRTEGSQQHDNLFFDLQYLTDELVFYSLKERWNKGGATLELPTVKLAKLLYCCLYRCQIFQLCLESCQSFTALDTQILAEETMDGELYLTRTSPRRDPATTSSQNKSQRHPLGKVIPIPPIHCFKFVENWTGQLRHFLSFFPDTRDDISSLRDLDQQLQDVLVLCSAALDRYS
ncbi:uncharacterized protein [Physcomitrium patens]|uniref:MSP domain-containing protein n=1 Tax=Physcomitrium patens TaxID=3218 RepID=A0A2K1KP58_PHYPA|nr:uncharacterized protein LOC112281477 [Physcomitrium patens]XP_024373820.1 uncharacterized protein LOC112281477 [Physcomitrium patens]PNR55568.1 hypothetical protein PHYPA_006465 [Physcomitrium patens]|eukprot:XP_024373819.1 uncharacterized protein LOC112281477 [Physcomitrella patens]